MSTCIMSLYGRIKTEIGGKGNGLFQFVHPKNRRNSSVHLHPPPPPPEPPDLTRLNTNPLRLEGE